VDRYPLKKYPVVGVCGLDCGLCLRYYTEGVSRCPGCCGPGFWEKMPGCGFITCCVKKKGLETCAQCVDFDDCERLAGLLALFRQKDSFISHRPIEANLLFIRERGIEEFAHLEMEKQEFLKYLLNNYDEGRSKSFYCTSCQLVPLDKLKDALKEVEKEITQDTPLKERAKTLRALIGNMAESLGIDLRLRK
jgi:hypothetical protein